MMVLGATGSLARARGFKFRHDFIDRCRIASDRLCDWTTTERTKALTISREIHFWNGNALALDVAPDIDFGPIEQRLDADMFAFCGRGRELPPEFRRLIFVIPFELPVLPPEPAR